VKTESGLWLPHGAQVPLLPREHSALGDRLDGRAEVEVGLFNTGHGFVFVCPVCGKRERNDQRMEPACTGPGWTDDHELTPMVLKED
jgi:hypothetical protein